MFKLMVIVVTSLGYSHSYSRGEFYDYQSCVAAAVGEVETMRPHDPDKTIKWQCVPEKK